MPRWGMVIDLQKCIGCKSCVVGCREANKVPQNAWKRVDDCGVSASPERHRMFLHVSCMQCSDPFCLPVCPTKATFRRPDGIICIDYTRCVGCGYCMLACPYDARSRYTTEDDFEVYAMSGISGRRNARSGRDGVCTKCNFCMDRIDAGIARGRKPGVDADASPVCMISCSAGAIAFGDMEDPGDAAARLVRERKTARLQEELGTGPSVYYLLPGGPQ